MTLKAVSLLFVRSSLFLQNNSLFAFQNSLFRRVGNSAKNSLEDKAFSAARFAPDWVIQHPVRQSLAYSGESLEIREPARDLFARAEPESLGSLPAVRVSRSTGQKHDYYPGRAQGLDSDDAPRTSVQVLQAQKGIARVRLKDTNEFFWTATANLAFNDRLVSTENTKAPASLDVDTTIRNLPRARGWVLEGGKVCADNIALRYEADCPSPDVGTKCAGFIDAAANFVISAEEQEKFDEMSESPEIFSEAERIRFIKYLRSEACPNYPSGAHVSLVLLDPDDQAVVLVPGNTHTWYTSSDNLTFGVSSVQPQKGPELR
jgi:hypothetical protein